MAKQRKSAYGIAEDGTSLQLANLSREGSQISLQALEQVELARSLHQHADEITPDVEVNSIDEINLDDFAAENEASFSVPSYEALFKSNSLNQGILAVNLFEEQIIKLPIINSELSQKKKTQLIKENIPRSEFKDGHWQSSIVKINDQAELWIHHGANRLLDILEDTAAAQKFKYFYQLADANEIALANLFKLNLPPDSDESCMILFLGSEYRRALLFEDNKWTFSLPIHVTGHQPDIDIIYSKLSLAMDEAHITDPKNLFVCGDNFTDDSVVFLRNQLPNTHVDIWKLPALNIDADANQAYDAAQIARFILPIALAWKALTQENSASIKSNFLPYYVIESQKVFKLAWHGYLILTLIFISSLVLTKTWYKNQFELQQEKLKNKTLFEEYTSKKEQAEKMMTMSRAIDVQSANIDVIKLLLAGKNPWSEIISRLNGCIQSHPTSWVTNLRKNETGFQIIGVTTNRPNIVVFSNLFPNGSITKVSRRSIHSFSVWDFEINYSYPDVNWFQMMEADAQQLKQYQALQSGKALENAQPDNTAKDSKATPTTLSKTADKVKQAIDTNKKQTQNQKIALDIPVPSKSLLEDKTDPSVKAYDDFIIAFNKRSDWLLTDLGVKFINNYPGNDLSLYIRWYLSYRSWQSKQYDKPVKWLATILKTSNVVTPYSLLLLGAVYRDSGNLKKANETWKTIVQDYPQHQVAKTATKLLNEKH